MGTRSPPKLASDEPMVWEPESTTFDVVWPWAWTARRRVAGKRKNILRPVDDVVSRSRCGDIES